MFWKRHTEPVPVAVSTADIDTPQGGPLTIEEAARLWFKEKTGHAMPEEFKAWLRQLAHDEAVRVTTQTSVLSQPQITKLHESRRLATIKLDDTEKSLETVRRKQDWITRFNNLNLQLQGNRATLYETGKQHASMRDTIAELERHETFEPILALYNRYLTLKNELQTVRADASVLKRQSDEAEAEATQAHSIADKASKQSLDAARQLRDSMEMLASGFKMDGATETLGHMTSVVQEWHKAAQTKLETIRRNLAALNTEAEDKARELQECKAKLQTFEPHAAMLKEGSAILVKLDRLNEIDEKREELRRRAVQTAAKQRGLDDRLAQLFAQDQAIVASLHSLQDEVQMHRQSNLGVDGTRLQARAIELKVRRMNLQMAQQHWTRICSLYTDMDERRQALSRLRLHMEQNEQAIDKLKSEVRQLRQQAEQRRYTYTVSKSQNVIKLRADLREGTPCSVCGAMNHPYHSDTMTEQNLLMGEWKAEAEMLANELRGKEAQLETMQTTHATELGQYTADQEFLRGMQEEYRQITRDWAQYASLDNSFHDCNPASSAEARQIMLRQLIENNDKQVTETQQELDTYNYHQMAINRATEQTDELENRRADLNAALNETNTGCQVVAGGVERLQKRINSLTTAYTTLLNDLSSIISLPDWAAHWRAGHESFKQDLRQRMDERDNLLSDTARMERELAVLHTRISAEQHNATLQEGVVITIQQQIDKMATRQKATTNAYVRTFGDQSASEAYDNALRALTAAEQESLTRQAELDAARQRHMLLAGKAEAALASTARLDEQVSELHRQIDEWIRVFNTSHPPVQYAELERFFSESRDWDSQRQAVRKVQREHMLAQAREEDLRSAVLALQADEHRALDSRGETMESLIAQRETLECRRRDIMQEIAAIDHRLAAHESALKQIETLDMLTATHK